MRLLWGPLVHMNLCEVNPLLMLLSLVCVHQHYTPPLSNFRQYSRKFSRYCRMNASMHPLEIYFCDVFSLALIKNRKHGCSLNDFQHWTTVTAATDVIICKVSDILQPGRHGGLFHNHVKQVNIWMERGHSLHCHCWGFLFMSAAGAESGWLD